jgi:glycerophosphoryl diester phosphodiesterase
MSERKVLFLFLNSLLVVTSGLPSIGQAAGDIYERLNGFQVGGHRGLYYSKYAPNSLEAFDEAIRQKADIVEMDLNLSQDGVVFVFHSNSMNKDTNCEGLITQKNAQEILECEYNEGQKLVTFEQALVTLGDRAVINAEFKSLNVIEPAIQLIQKHLAYERVYFQTNVDKKKYNLARSVDAHVALLFAPPEQESLEWALGLDDPRLVVIELHENVRTKENIARIHALGKITSENSWPEATAKERFGASCEWVFKKGIRIATSKRPEGCVRQRDRIARRH